MPRDTEFRTQISAEVATGVASSVEDFMVDQSFLLREGSCAKRLLDSRQ
jgi:hypothetical protein